MWLERPVGLRDPPILAHEGSSHLTSPVTSSRQILTSLANSYAWKSRGENQSYLRLPFRNTCRHAAREAREFSRLDLAAPHARHRDRSPKCKHQWRCCAA